MVKKGILIVVLGLMSGIDLAHAQSDQTKIKALYGAQCLDAGGVFNGACICGEKQELLTFVANVAEAAVTTKNVDASTFGIVNPFLATCGGRSLNPEKTIQRLRQMVDVSRKYIVEKPELLEEIQVLASLDLLHPDAYNKYQTQGKVREQMKAKIDGYKKKFEMIAQRDVRALAQVGHVQVKGSVVNNIQSLIGIDVAESKAMAKAFQAALATSVQNGKSTKMAIKDGILNVGKDMFKRGVKQLSPTVAKTLVIGAALYGVYYYTGVDLWKYDQDFVATMGDGTMNGSLVKNIELIYEPGFYEHFNAAMAKDPTLFVSKITLVTMITEARYNGDSFSDVVNM